MEANVRNGNTLADGDSVMVIKDLHGCAGIAGNQAELHDAGVKIT
jgi:uncharacterized Zn ribbon protein